MSLEQLLSRIPSRLSAPTSVGSPPPRALSEPDQGQIFVAPELSLVQASNQTSEASAVALISASAAVGKTMLANHLAKASNNPYWDLGRFAMGSGFFSGTLSSTYGVTNYATLIQELQNGSLCLILDAADEAVVASTTSNYIAALENLAEIVCDSDGSRYSAVILGRPETIADTCIYLDDLGITSDIYEVSYFNEEAAKKFVRTQAERDSNGPIAELDEFIETFFERIKAAFKSRDWDVVGSFLGYAPVLDSMALFSRKTENPFRDLRQFASDDQKTWHLVAEMLDWVLKRETEKFSNSFGGSDSAKRNFAGSAYTPSIQVRWLLSDDISGFRLDPDMSLLVNAEWLDDLELRAMEQFEVHPFLKTVHGAHKRNVLLDFTSTAFRDFALARFIATPELEDLLPALYAYWAQPEIVPSPMLPRFLSVFVENDDISMLCPEAVPILLDSHAEQSASSNPGSIVIEWFDDDEEERNTGEPEFDAVSVTWTDRGGRASTCSVPVISQSIILGRSLAFTAIDLPGARLTLGHRTPEASIGPSVALRCSDFSPQCTALHIHSTESFPGVQQLPGVDVWTDSVGGNVRKISGAKPQLRLRVPTAAHPWQSHRIASDGSTGLDPAELMFTALSIRRIANRFFRGGVRFNRTKLDTILRKGRASRSVFDQLVRMDRIWTDGSNYRMELGVSSTPVRSLDLSDHDYKQLVEDVHRGAS